MSETTKEQRQNIRAYLHDDGTLTADTAFRLLDDADALASAEQELARLRVLRAAYLDADPLICPECGPVKSTDEDGLCHSCGMSVTHDEDGNVLDTAPNQFQRLRARVAEQERDAAVKALGEIEKNDDRLPDDSAGHVTARGRTRRVLAAWKAGRS